MGKAKQVLNLVEGKDDIFDLLDNLDQYANGPGKIDLPKDVVKILTKELGKSEYEYFVDEILTSNSDDDVADWGKENAKSVAKILKAVSK